MPGMAKSAMPGFVVIKIGGSLYSLPDLATRLARMIARTEETALIIPGGGEAANLVREWQPRFGWTDAAAHQMACESLSFNARMLRQLIPQAILITDRDELLLASSTRQVAILDVARCPTVMDDSGDDSLPPVWDVTSDSIAAYVAVKWSIDRLLMLKSVDLPTELPTLGQAVAAGHVDPYFAGLAGHIPEVWWCNLRAEIPQMRLWLHEGARI